MDLNEDNVNFLRADLLKSEEFISYIGVPLVAKGQLKGILEVFQRSPLNPDDGWKDFLQISRPGRHRCGQRHAVR